MSITFLGALTAASASAGSLAFANTTYTTGNVVVGIALGSTSVSVSSITFSGTGTYSAPTRQAAVNGTGVRTEVWTFNVTVSGTAIATVNLSGTTSIAQVLSEYSGVTAYGHTATNTRTDNNFLPGTVTVQDSNNFLVGVYGWVYTNNDSLSFAFANSRGSIGNAAGSIAAWITDASTTLSGQVATVWAGSWNSTSAAVVTRNNACALLELRSGIATTAATSFAATTAPSTQVARDFRTLNVTCPLFEQTQLYPTQPSSPAVNSGFIG